MLTFAHLVLSTSGIMRIFDPNEIGNFLEDISPWHYVFLFGVIFAESGVLIGIFLPGDSLLFVAGFLAFKDDLNIWILLPLFFIAAFTGDQVGYLFGKSAGEHFFKKEGRILKKSHIEKTHAFFEKHGPKTIVLARFVPIVRTVAPIMAGTAEMKYKTFVTFNVIGAALWGIGVTLLGYFLGQSIGAEKIDKYLLPIIGVIIALSLIAPMLEYLKSRHDAQEHKKTKVDSSQSV